MKHLNFIGKDQYTTALLIKESSLTNEVKKAYAIDWEDTICFSLTYESNKATAKLIKESLVNIYKACNHFKVKNLLVCDSNYFKTMVGVTKVENLYGSIYKAKNQDFNVILAPNYQAIFYDPKIQDKLDLAVNTLKQYLQGSHTVLGEDVIHFAEYPTGAAIQEWLQKLLEQPVLACDTENLGLTLADADLVSIAFSWSQNEGIAFLVEDKQVLKQFFEQYKGKLMFHNGSYDITHLIYRLFMRDYLDYEGLLQGLDCFSNIEDTKIIAYLATNSCAGNDLKLKNLALEFAGNYGILDEEDSVKNIPTDKLLKYNLVDVLATWFVYNKYKPIMIQDNQSKIYEEIMLPSIRSIVHMQLIGFPMDKEEIHKTANELMSIQQYWLKELSKSKLVKEYEWTLQVEAFTKKNKELKTKHILISEFKTSLNPNSGKQLIGLLYKHLGLPVINATDSGQPSTDGDTLESLYKQLTNTYEIQPEELK